MPGEAALVERGQEAVERDRDAEAARQLQLERAERQVDLGVRGAAPRLDALARHDPRHGWR